MFDPNEHKDDGRFDALPAGDYKVSVESCEYGDNKSGNGKLIKLKLSVLGGEFENRKLFHNFNIQHPNKTAQSIGQGDFARFLLAIKHGPINLDEVGKLVDKNLVVTLNQFKDNYRQGELNNAIKEFKPIDQSGGVKKSAQEIGAEVEKRVF